MTEQETTASNKQPSSTKEMKQVKDNTAEKAPTTEMVKAQEQETENVGKTEKQAEETKVDDKKVDEKVDDRKGGEEDEGEEEQQQEKAGDDEETDRLDESWYGKSPEEDKVELIKKELGEKVSELYIRAYRQYKGAEKDSNAQRLITASGTFVEALKIVPENMQMTGAFGEISLAYGKSLVRYIEIEGSGSTAVTSKIVKAIQNVVQGGNNSGQHIEHGDDKEAEETENKNKNKDDTKAEQDQKSNDDVTEQLAKKDKDNSNNNEEEDLENDKDDEENLETAWTHLEISRVIFSQQKNNEGEGECRYTLGELLMACDEGKQAGSEFSTAVKLFTDDRRKAECCYKQYLAVRNYDRSQAVQALKHGVDIIRNVEDAKQELEDMKLELKDIQAAVDEEEKSKPSSAPTEVQVVRPKRKRDVVGEKESKPKANGGDEKPEEEVVNGNGSIEGACSTAKNDESAKDSNTDAGTETRDTKKARVEEVKA